MQGRDPNTRTIPPIQSKEQWDALVKTIETEGDAIVESESGAKVAVIPYDEFLELQEQRKNRLREEAYVRLQEAMKEQEKLNQEISEEEAEQIAQEFSRDFYDDLADRGVINIRRTGKA
jgi:PHD/YefM family antitoxin component YafN of YafNO toxin-antitoxin module